jgi:hypothetical protein
LLLDVHGVPLDAAALRQRIRSMLAGRVSYYERAHVVVDGDRPAAAVTQAVLEALRQRATDEDRR